ncbi:unnamed protein product, partial [Dicrocoelium dendriticum]
MHAKYFPAFPSSHRHTWSTLCRPFSFSITAPIISEVICVDEKDPCWKFSNYSDNACERIAGNGHAGADKATSSQTHPCPQTIQWNYLQETSYEQNFDSAVDMTAVTLRCYLQRHVPSMQGFTHLSRGIHRPGKGKVNGTECFTQLGLT